MRRTGCKESGRDRHNIDTHTHAGDERTHHHDGDGPAGGAATLGCWTLSAAPFASALAFSVVKVPRRFLGSSSKSAIPKVKACGDLSTYDLVCGQEAKLWVGRDHGVARIELDRMQSRNALGNNMLTDLEHCVVKASELTIDHTIRCVVVHSCTESVFCAGKSKRVLDWSGGEKTGELTWH